jgi:hypothetical protein
VLTNSTAIDRYICTFGLRKGVIFPLTVPVYKTRLLSLFISDLIFEGKAFSLFPGQVKNWRTHIDKINLLALKFYF